MTGKREFVSRLQAERRQLGMTLMELMLVVAIMVVVAALAIPSVQRTFANQALQKGADRVRVAMGQARIKAIRNGEEYAVFLVPGGAYFTVAPFRSFQQQTSIASQRNELAMRGGHSNYEEDLLPQGVLFVNSESSADSRAVGVLSNVGSSGSLQTILFYPDGTSQDARVVVQNEKQATMQIQLRGLTGIAKTVRLDENESR